jgi:hypothetical protein
MSQPLTYDAGFRWDTPGLVWDGMVPETNTPMPTDNQVSAVLTDQNVTDILGHIAAIETLLPFLLSRATGDNLVMLGEKTVAFDEKCAAYMASHPEFTPSYANPAEVLKDRALRVQIDKFRSRLNLLAAKTEDTYNVAGNEVMMVNLVYYGNTAEAAKRGRTNAGDIHSDLATRYPGRGSKKTTQPTPK